MPKSFLRKSSASNYLTNDTQYHTFWEKFFLSDCEAMEQALHWPTGVLKNGGHIFIMSTQVFLRPETLFWHFQLVSLVNSKISTALCAKDWTNIYVKYFSYYSRAYSGIFRTMCNSAIFRTLGILGTLRNILKRFGKISNGCNYFCKNVLI